MSDLTPRGVIHDLGYRPYEGSRHTEPAIAWALFVDGLRHAFGIGRSGKSKILPFTLLAFNLLPALIIVGIMVWIGLSELPVGYAAYASVTQMLLSIFVAAQAPVLFSRDLRHGSIVLYLARPLRSATYALVRWASLWVAILIYLLTPTLLLYLGAVLAESDLVEQTTDMLQATLLIVVLAAVLAGVAGVISAWTQRRGFAVLSTIMVLLVSNAVVTVVQEIAFAQDQSSVGEVVGLLSPYTLYRGTVTLFFDPPSSVVTPPDGAMSWLYLGVSVLIAVACPLILVWRYRKVAGR